MIDNTNPDPDMILRDEAAAWWHLAYAVGVELRRRLIPLVRARLFTLDLACRVLKAAGLPALPRTWRVQVIVHLHRHINSTSPDGAISTFHDDLDQAVRRTLGPAAIVTFYQPPRVQAAEYPDHRGYHVSAQPAVITTARAENDHQAQTTVLAPLLAALNALPGAAAGLDPDVGVHVAPDTETPTDLDVESDAQRQPFTLPPGHAQDSTMTAATARRLAMQAWQDLVRNIRSELIDALVSGDIDEQPGRSAPYAVVDDLLRELGLAGLPRANLYRIDAAVPVTVTADSSATARLAAYRMLRDASATCPQYGLPITVSSTFRDPDIVPDVDGRYRVTWRQAYLVCLRATSSTRLAEQAVRLQLSVLADRVPGIAAVPLATTYLGEYVDHRLDPDRD